jgi:hypothetical protein
MIWERLLVGLTRHEQGRVFGELRQLPDSREGSGRESALGAKVSCDKKKKVKCDRARVVDKCAGWSRRNNG